MNNTRNSNCSTRNPRTPSSCCPDSRASYNNSGCDCYPKIESAKDMVLAMAYVPWQQFSSVCEPDKALQMGTIFPELYKPYIGCKGGRC